MNGGDATPTQIESLLGIAMGCIGLSLDDFCRCTPSEFYAVFDGWNQNRTAVYRTGWEQTRFLALAALQPHSSKPLRPGDIMPLPWETENRPDDTKKADEMSSADIMERYKAAKKRYGL